MNKQNDTSFDIFRFFFRYLLNHVFEGTIVNDMFAIFFNLAQSFAFSLFLQSFHFSSVLIVPSLAFFPSLLF